MRGVWINDTFHPDTGRRTAPPPATQPYLLAEAQRYGKDRRHSIVEDRSRRS